MQTTTKKSSNKQFKQSIYDMVDDFEKIELDTSQLKPRVGIVGEVLIKYHPFGNNYVANLLEKKAQKLYFQILWDLLNSWQHTKSHLMNY